MRGGTTVHLSNGILGSPLKKRKGLEQVIRQPPVNTTSRRRKKETKPPKDVPAPSKQCRYNMVK